LTRATGLAYLFKVRHARNESLPGSPKRFAGRQRAASSARCRSLVASGELDEARRGPGQPGSPGRRHSVIGDEDGRDQFGLPRRV